MTGIESVERVYRAVRDFYRGAPGKPGLLARVLQPLFSRLSTETQLFLAHDVMLAMTKACLEAKVRFGDEGNVIVDGNEIRVGTGGGEGFVVLGRGRTWDEAFAEAERG